MASNSDFVQYIADQCSGAGTIVAKKMFGEYGISDVDDHDYLSTLVRETCRALPEPKPKKNKWQWNR